MLAAGGIILAALTPAKVSDVETDSSGVHKAKAPSLIYVHSFTISQPAARPDDASSNGRPHLLGALRGGEQNTLLGRHQDKEKEKTLAKLPGILQKALIEDLSRSIAPATAADGERPSRRDGWVISGEFIDLEMGRRALEAGVGFGAGQGDVEVRVKVYVASDMSRPFLTFDDKGASGHMPGAVLMRNPYGAAAKFILSKRDPEREAKKVAQAIAHEIGKFMAAQGIPTRK